MVIIGDEHLRVVVYPIGPDVINWLLVRPVPGETGEWATGIASSIRARWPLTCTTGHSTGSTCRR